MGIYLQYQQLIGADKNFKVSDSNVQATGDAAAALISQKLLTDKPALIGRFGATELNCILNYHFIKGGIVRNVSNLVKGIPFFMNYKKGLISTGIQL